MGAGDPYLPALKGWLSQNAPQANVVDINHQISRCDMEQAAYVLAYAARYFPPETIHLVGIEEENADRFAGRPPYIVARMNQQYFIARDHGLLSLMDMPLPAMVRSLEPDNALFPLLEVAAPAACQILQGVLPEQTADANHEPFRRQAVQPTIGANYVQGLVIYIDHYGNAITNIRREHLERMASQSGSLRIYYTSNDPIAGLSENYQDVPLGEHLALINSMGHVEIAVHGGSAYELMALRADRKPSIIQIKRE